MNPTFNSITVDGDTSTNDTVALLANGQSGARPITGGANYQKLFEAVHAVCKSLALAIVADGEGAQRVIEIEVRGAPSDKAADQIARTIANSPLVKTAVAGADPNWGRIIAAAGRSGVKFDSERVDIWLAGVEVCRGGREYPFDEIATHEKMLEKSVSIRSRSACGGRKGAHVDLRFHQGIHPHQRELPHLIRFPRNQEKPFAVRPSLVPLPAGVLLAQFKLQKFPHGSARNFAGENESVRQLPFRETLREKGAQLIGLRVHTVFCHHHRQRTFLPFRMRYADHRRFAHGRMAHQRIFQIDGADPFAARFDQVLAAVDDFDIALTDRW